LRGDFEFNGRFFAVGGDQFYEILSGGYVISIGSVGIDGLPCTDDQGNLLKTDQRGLPRPDHEDTGGRDIGAYENQSD